MSDRFIQLGKPVFVPGFWRGMTQPATVVPWRLTRAEVRLSTLQRFDALRAVLPLYGEKEGGAPPIQTDVAEHPVLGRILALCVDLLAHVGMPVMSGSRAFRVHPMEAQNWLVGLPAIDAAIRAPDMALSWACALMNELDLGKPLSAAALNAELSKFMKRHRPSAPAGVNTLRFLQAAHELGIPWRHVANNVYQFGWGKYSRWLDSSFTDETSTISAGLARDKVASAKVLRAAGLPVAKHQLVASAEQAAAVANGYGYPVVVKPANLDGGLGVMAGLRTAEAVKRAFDAAAKLSKRVLVEQFVEGSDYRVRVCKGLALSVVVRRPASVVGDGQSTVRALIDKINQERAERKQPLEPDIEQGLKPIAVDHEVLTWLEAQELGIGSVAAKDQRVRLRGAANVSLGGTTWDVTHEAHPDNLDLAVKAAAALRLDLAGIDLLLPDIAISWKQSGGSICEINGQPQFSHGVHGELLSHLLYRQGRIPVVALGGRLPAGFDIQALVDDFQRHGRKLAWASSVDTCRIFLFDKTVDAVIWHVEAGGDAQQIAPVDAVSWSVEVAQGKQTLASNIEAVSRFKVSPGVPEKSPNATRLVSPADLHPHLMQCLLQQTSAFAAQSQK
jgi:cyanophycin synthetase